MSRKSLEKSCLMISLAILFMFSSSCSKAQEKDEKKENGPMLVESYIDYQCPYCGRVNALLQKIREEYADKVIIAIRQFPLPFHANAAKASEAAECARDQEKFDEMHNLLFANQQKLAIKDLKSYAAQLKLDQDKFNECLDSGIKADKIKADTESGRKFGVEGTPSFVIGGELLVGALPWEDIKYAIDTKFKGESFAEHFKPKEPEPLDTSKDPVINLIVLVKPDCEQCEYKQLLDRITRKIFPTSESRVVDACGDEGKKLMDEYGVEALPAFIFSTEVQQAAYWDPAAFTPRGDSFLMSPDIVQPGYYLKTPPVGNAVAWGSNKARVTIILFADVQCSYCKKVQTTIDQIWKEYSKKARLVFKHFPLPFHAQAQKAAEALECARDQSHFWGMLELIYQNKSRIEVKDLKALAAKLELNTGKFDKCLDSGVKAGIMEADLKEGAKYGVSGTPGIFINNYFFAGAYPYEALKKVIDSELARAEKEKGNK